MTGSLREPVTSGGRIFGAKPIFVHQPMNAMTPNAPNRLPQIPCHLPRAVQGCRQELIVAVVAAADRLVYGANEVALKTSETSAIFRETVN